MNNKKIAGIALAAVVLSVGLLVRFGALAGSETARESAVMINMPAAQSLNLTLSGDGSLGAAEGEVLLGGRVHNTQESFDEGIAVDGTEVISGSGALIPASVKISSSGTTIDKHVRTTFTVNPDSIAASSATTSAVVLTGAGANDHCAVNSLSGDILSTTSTAMLNCRITAADTATVYYRNVSSTAAFDGGSSVLSIQAWSY